MRRPFSAAAAAMALLAGTAGPVLAWTLVDCDGGSCSTYRTFRTGHPTDDMLQLIKGRGYYAMAVQAYEWEPASGLGLEEVELFYSDGTAVRRRTGLGGVPGGSRWTSPRTTSSPSRRRDHWASAAAGRTCYTT
jgi:hypothetical protein